MRIVMRRWQWLNNGYYLVYTKEYLKFMRKLKLEEVSSFKHEIVKTDKETKLSGSAYDTITIKTKPLTRKVA